MSSVSTAHYDSGSPGSCAPRWHFPRTLPITSGPSSISFAITNSPEVQHYQDSTTRRRRSRPGDKWQMDEVFLTIKGARHYLWRAVDQEGNVLDILVQRRRDKRAAKKFFRKLLKGLMYVPRVLITDKLKSYGAAKQELLPGVEHRQHRYLNNRAENSHQPTRQRERR